MIDLETAKAETRMHLLLASHHLFWLQHALRFKIRQQYLLHDRRTMHLAETTLCVSHEHNIAITS